jgi:transcriptional regulator with XRE-family HTH domain
VRGGNTTKLCDVENANGDALVVAFGQQVRQLRYEQGLSQKQLAKLTGLSRTYISHVEHGRNVTLRAVSRFADGFGVHARDLFPRH